MDNNAAVPTTFILPTRERISIDEVDAVPQIGDGYYTAGSAYRVVDLWFVDDDSTPLPYGWVVFLEHAPSAGNRLLAFDESFFG